MSFLFFANYLHPYSPVCFDQSELTMVGQIQNEPIILLHQTNMLLPLVRKGIRHMPLTECFKLSLECHIKLCTLGSVRHFG